MSGDVDNAIIRHFNILIQFIKLIKHFNIKKIIKKNITVQ